MLASKFLVELGPALSLIISADITIFFLEASLEKARALKASVICFKMVSGLRTNLSKLKILVLAMLTI